MTTPVDNAASNATATPSSFPIPANVFALTVQDVKHYTDRLFRFRLNRPDSFRFRSGEFVMIGLPNAEKPVSVPIPLQVRSGASNWSFSPSRFRMAL